MVEKEKLNFEAFDETGDDKTGDELSLEDFQRAVENFYKE